MTHAIVHRALWEYLVAVTENPDEVEREKQRREMFEWYVCFLSKLEHVPIFFDIAVKSFLRRLCIQKTGVA